VSLLPEQSPAFRRALLRSERLRILILLCVLAALMILRVIRTVIAWSPENVSSLIWLGLFAGALVVVELFFLHAVKKAVHNNHGRVSHSVWLGNILVETCMPALLIFFINNPAEPPAERVLTHPAFALYFVLIILSTLRLSPRTSLLCGVIAAASYLTAAYGLGWQPIAAIQNLSLLSPPKVIVTFALSLLIGGGAAALVAREVRKQVDAALREAETRREVEQLQHDLEVARSIQQSLLPRAMPKVGGFDLAAWNKPADQTGGDYYDWQPLPDGRVLLALADVTGHGIGPALLAAICRAYARAHFGQQTVFLKAMEQINSAIAGDVTEGRFVNFVVAVLDAKSPDVELLSAGQAPLFLYWLKHDRFDQLEAQGLPLGISVPLVSDPPLLLNFESGDLLVLATDGFFEWANPSGNFFGTERLQDSVRAARDKPAAEIISCLYQDVLRYADGAPQKDDLTAIVIKRL
jgi:serine phosphatase RsbU (regulator of sigma subunit)